MSLPTDFYNKDFLTQHIQSILAFYDDRVIDEAGGYFQNFYDNGEVFDAGAKQLVSSTRIIVNYANAYRLFDRAEYASKAIHGLDFLEQVHWQSDSQLYAWTLLDNKPQDMTQQAYGYAFVLLAYAAVHKSKIISVADKIAHTFDLLESRFWQAEYGLYADEISPQGELSDYRGQNSNMHLCEAMLLAYEATAEQRYLDRATLLANNICQRQANLTDGLVWEHYKTDFSPDWDYNKDDPKNLYRPWGFQPGHQTEWTKLLLSINRHSPNSALVEKAKFLFDKAFAASWDNRNGGLIYGFDPEGNTCDDDKYFWVQAESFAAAAMLFDVTADSQYLHAYQALWRYSWEHMIDHQYGAWFRVLRGDNSKYNNEKSSAGAKCDYHTLGACFEVLRVLG